MKDSPLCILDTNIVLYLLGGKLAQPLPENFVYAVSFITEMELLSYPNLDENSEREINEFLSDILVLDLTKEIKIQAISLRQKYNIKLPDAIISATAVTNTATLLSNDKKLKTIIELKPETLALLD
ncbi:MAG: tRNA(fMet)-specific endonuclease VapC [marine bacterium B5-7]|nr:MAG: tRNA(fMet)-specific endonuclease VapC [marine bacterium B5-7]